MLVDFLSQSVPHVKDTPLCVRFIGLRAQELHLWKCNREYILEGSHVKRRPLEPVAEYKQVDSSVSIGHDCWVYFVLQIFKLKSVGNVFYFLVLDVALFKNQGGVFLLVLLLWLFLGIYPYFFQFYFFTRERFWLFHFLSHLYGLSDFLSYVFVELTSGVFTGEGEVTGLNDMPEDLFSISLLKHLLVLHRHDFVDSLRLEKNQFEQVVLKLKQLTCQVIDLHDDGIGYLLRIT
jgi:hypothetical protein